MDNLWYLYLNQFYSYNYLQETALAYIDYIEWKDWKDETFGNYSDYDHLYFAAEIGPYVRPAGTKIPLLVEIGFGNGALLKWCREHDIEAIGTEIQPALQERARNAGFHVVDGLAEIPAETADAVIALDVFEHVPYDDLVALCREINRVLKPGGHLVARFPNGDSPFSMIFQNGDVTHVHALGSYKVRRIMAETGLHLEALKAPFEPRLSLKGRLFQPVRRLMRAAFAAYVRYAFLEGNTPATFTMNCVLVARKPMAAR